MRKTNYSTSFIWSKQCSRHVIFYMIKGSTEFISSVPFSNWQNHWFKEPFCWINFSLSSFLLSYPSSYTKDHLMPFFSFLLLLFKRTEIIKKKLPSTLLFPRIVPFPPHGGIMETRCNPDYFLFLASLPEIISLSRFFRGIAFSIFLSQKTISFT